MLSEPQNQRAEKLRRRYPLFCYEGFGLEAKGASLHINFYYRTPPDFLFTTQVVLEAVPDSYRLIPQAVVNNLLFHLGMIESLNYWKATCSPSIRITAGSLGEHQIEWWSDLLLHGMREYFYVNNIDFARKDFIRISAPKSESKGQFELCAAHLADRSLIPLGGGRDSALTARALQKAGQPFDCLLLEPIPASLRVAAAVDCEHPIIVRRDIDPLLFELNKDGFLNGHVPFSAFIGFLSALCLVLYNYRNVIVANERSSDEPNTTFLGKRVNHQYSKSFGFEKKLDEYLQRYLVSDGRYFSFVRPLYELQIGRAFSKYPELFDMIRSCNKNQREDSWCGNCPKCLSVFMTAYPFVSSSDLNRMFGRDFFEGQNSIRVICELAGVERHKPFECVTTLREAIASLYLCVKKCKDSGNALPVALKYAEDYILPTETEAHSMVSAILNDESGRHRIPAEFERVLRLSME